MRTLVSRLVNTVKNYKQNTAFRTYMNRATDYVRQNFGTMSYYDAKLLSEDGVPTKAQEIYPTMSGSMLNMAQQEILDAYVYQALHFATDFSPIGGLEQEQQVVYVANLLEKLDDILLEYPHNNYYKQMIQVRYKDVEKLYEQCSRSLITH